MGNRYINIIVFYIFFQYIFYDLYGNWFNNLHYVYYHSVPVIFIIAIIINENLIKNLSKLQRYYLLILIIVILYHYFRIVFKYTPEYSYYTNLDINQKLIFLKENPNFSKIFKLKESSPIYYSTVLYLFLSIIYLIYYKGKMILKWLQRKN